MYFIKKENSNEGETLTNVILGAPEREVHNRFQPIIFDCVFIPTLFYLWSLTKHDS